MGRNEVSHEQAMRGLGHIKEVGVALADCVWPVYTMRGRHPDAEGSSVLLRIREKSFLLTAAHVVDARANHRLVVGLGNELIDLDADCVQTTLQEGKSRDADHIDLAVCYLEDSTTSHLTGGFVDLSRIVPVETLPIEAPHLMIGYPVTKQPTGVKDGELAMNYAVVGLRSVREEEYRRSELDPFHHILLRHHQKNMWNPGGYGAGIKPVGLSGGAVWVVPELFESTEPKAHLAGIATEWRKHSKHLLSTRVQLCLAVIYRDFPALRDEIRPYLD
jgi:hypothetical protein